MYQYLSGPTGYKIFQAATRGGGYRQGRGNIGREDHHTVEIEGGNGWTADNQFPGSRVGRLDWDWGWGVARTKWNEVDFPNQENARDLFGTQLQSQFGGGPEGTYSGSAIRI